jgi:hypothetical protein
MARRSLALLSAEHIQRIEAAHPLAPGNRRTWPMRRCFCCRRGTLITADLAVDGGFTAQ